MTVETSTKAGPMKGRAVQRHVVVSTRIKTKAPEAIAAALDAAGIEADVSVARTAFPRPGYGSSPFGPKLAVRPETSEVLTEASRPELAAEVKAPGPIDGCPPCPPARYLIEVQLRETIITPAILDRKGRIKVDAVEGYRWCASVYDAEAQERLARLDRIPPWERGARTVLFREWFDNERDAINAAASWVAYYDESRLREERIARIRTALRNEALPTNRQVTLTADDLA